MAIFTSSWFTKLPPDMVRIGISRGVPRNMPGGYRMLRKLAPGEWFKRVSVEQYKKLFFEDLDQLNAKDVVAVIEKVSDGNDAALLCFESPRKMEDWCHRGFVSAWLHDQLGIEVYEYGMVDHGCGWQHPKIPPRYRAAPAPAPIDVTPFMGKRAFHDGATWSVLGVHPDHPDQALIKADDGREMAVSEEVLQKRFGGLL